MVGELSRIAALAAAILAAGVSSAAENDVLYWMVDDTAEVNEWWASGAGRQNIKDYFSNYVSTHGDGATSDFAARVRVVGGNIQDGQDVFLDLYIPGYGIDVGSGEYGVLFSDDVGGYWGAGVPTGNQSPSGDYSAGSPEYSFIVELGNIDANDNWTTVATSAARTYTEIATAGYIHQTFDLNPGSLAAWMPTMFIAVPEPSGGMLMAIGIALLALRRRRLSERV